jgi:uncharacterized tellurite resistance protein B-like protein
MSIADLYSSGKHKNNVAHFASIVSLATASGTVNEDELIVINRLAQKLDITESEYDEIISKGKQYSIEISSDKETRLERMFDFFKIVYSDHELDEAELKMLNKYAIGIGFSAQAASKIIAKSILLFEGKFSFEEYQMLLK